MPSKADLARQIGALLEKFEPRVRAAFLAAVQDLRDRADLAGVVTALERGDIAGALAALNLDAAAFRAFEAVIAEAYSAFGSNAVAHFPVIKSPEGFRVAVRFDVRDLRSEQVLRELSSNLVTQIVDEQKLMVRAALVEGMAQGQNPRATALEIVGRVDPAAGRRTGGIIGLSGPQERTVAKVRAGLASGDPEALKHYLTLTRRDKRFDRSVAKALREGKALTGPDAERIVARLSDSYLKLRGEMVARTETLSAMNAARHEAFAQGLAKTNYGPENVVREWSSAGDSRVRDTHRALDGQKVRGLDAAFHSPSGARLRYPGDTSLGAGPEETIGCRCVVNMRIDVFGAR